MESETKHAVSISCLAYPAHRLGKTAGTTYGAGDTAADQPGSARARTRNKTSRWSEMVSITLKARTAGGDENAEENGRRAADMREWRRRQEPETTRRGKEKKRNNGNRMMKHTGYKEKKKRVRTDQNGQERYWKTRPGVQDSTE